jgi:membrane-associated protein
MLWWIFMVWITNFFNFLFHLDDHLQSAIANYGLWTYLLLFLIIFCETGLIVTPFLPGDSLLFAVGTFAALGSFNLFLLMIILAVAAILGDTVNYWLGHYVGEKIFDRPNPFLNRKHLTRTQEFYKKHGNKAIILARFVPIVRTVIPFVAGVGTMNYPRFIVYNVVGGIAWVVIFLTAGFFFGNLPIVRDNFALVTLGIVLVSIVPIFYEMLVNKHKDA